MKFKVQLASVVITLALVSCSKLSDSTLISSNQRTESGDSVVLTSTSTGILSSEDTQKMLNSTFVKHQFSAGETIDIENSYGRIMRDGDVYVGEIRELPEMIRKYEKYLKDKKLSAQSIGVFPYSTCNFFFLGCWGWTYYDEKWPDTGIPYEIAPGVTGYQLSQVQRAIQDWTNRVSGIRWNYSSTAANRVRISNEEPDFRNCGSAPVVGNPGGIVELKMYNDDRCFGLGFIQHEMGHVAGLEYEQKRCDRDSYVTINIGNIIPARLPQFDKMCIGSRRDYGSYDYNSVMHYDSTAFSSNNGLTITPLNGVAPETIGQRISLSNGDVNGINEMYTWRFP